jgi:hypothetical protein
VVAGGEEAIVDIGEPPLGFAGFGRRSRARVGVSAPDFLGRFWSGPGPGGMFIDWRLPPEELEYTGCGLRKV